MKRTLEAGISWGVEVTQRRPGATSLRRMQMLVGSVFGFLLVVMIGVASADDTPTSNPALPETELVPAVVVAAGADSINTNAVTRVTAVSALGTQVGTAFRLDDGRVATVTHAVLEADEIGLSGGETFLPVDRADLVISRLHDLTTIVGTVEGPALQIAAEPATVGQSVALGGIPANGRIEAITGTIIDRAEGVAYGIGRPDVFAIDAEVAPGWSGGPVVNAAGEVVAIIIGTEQNTGITLAVPIEHLPVS